MQAFCEQGTEGVDSESHPYDDFQRSPRSPRRIDSVADDDLDDEYLDELM